MNFISILVASFLITHQAHALDVVRPQLKHVVTIVLENENFEDVLKNPYFAKLATRGALLTQFMGVAHPSQPNYIAMIAGDTLGVTGDRVKDLNGTHLGNLLTAKGLDWRAYAEDLPSPCYTGSSKGRYVRRHVPFMNFLNVQKDPKECAKIVNATEFKKDVAQGKLPAYSMYTPNMDNDGHDTNVAYSARWLESEFEPLFNDNELMQDTLFIITYDESSLLARKNQIYTVLLGANVIPGTQVSARLNHYSILRTIEDAFGIGTLGRRDLGASPIMGIWK